MNKREISLVEQYREAFDYAFLWHCKLDKEKVMEMFKSAGIDWFITKLLDRRVHWNFAHSYKSLQDLTKLSFSVYGNLDTLPLVRKISLPEKTGRYKFVVTWTSLFRFLKEGEVDDGNVIYLASGERDLSSGESEYHGDILKWMGYESGKSILETTINKTDIFGGWRLDINHEGKTLKIFRWSGWFDSCSNEMVERMLEDLEKQWYKIIVNLDNQKEFFKERK